MARSKTPSGGLLTQLFQGAPDGMNVAVPGEEIASTEARYIQDGLVHFPGRIIRRGPVKDKVLSGTTGSALGICSAVTPQGQVNYAVLSNVAGGGTMSFLSNDLTTIASTAVHVMQPGSISTNPYTVFDAKPALNGGTFITMMADYQAAGNQPNGYCALWGGANGADVTVSATATRSSNAVTGAANAFNNVQSGMFMFIATDDAVEGSLNYASGSTVSASYVGQVLSVNSGTSITLTAPSYVTGTAKTAYFTKMRGLPTAPIVVKGTITCASTHAHAHGGNTTWVSDLSVFNTWDLFRQRDTAYIGRVSSVQSDFAVTLTANAAIDCADEPYIAFPTGNTVWNGTFCGGVNQLGPGALTAIYAGVQWYANNVLGNANMTSRLWFTDPFSPDCYDTNTDGNWFDIYSSSQANQPIKGLVAVNNALLVLKDHETWAVFGQTPDTFQTKLLDTQDGCLSSMSIQAYGGGAIWAGHEGIKYYSGTSVQNLTEGKLGKYWRDLVSTFDDTKKRVWSMIGRGHYFLFMESVTPTIGVTKGASTTFPTKLTIAVNLMTGAITLLTNVDIRGSVVTMGSAAPTAYYLTNDGTNWHICGLDDLFDSTGADTIVCTGSSAAGPDWYLETKLHDAGDPTRVKHWRWVETNSWVQGDTLLVDAVLGLSAVDHTLANQILTSSNFSVDNRVYINWDSQLLGLRFYQNSSSVTNVQFGPYQIGLKIQRPGRPL